MKASTQIPDLFLFYHTTFTLTAQWSCMFTFAVWICRTIRNMELKSWMHFSKKGFFRACVPIITINKSAVCKGQSLWIQIKSQTEKDQTSSEKLWAPSFWADEADISFLLMKRDQTHDAENNCCPSALLVGRKSLFVAHNMSVLSRGSLFVVRGQTPSAVSTEPNKTTSDTCSSSRWKSTFCITMFLQDLLTLWNWCFRWIWKTTV